MADWHLTMEATVATKQSLRRFGVAEFAIPAIRTVVILAVAIGTTLAPAAAIGHFKEMSDHAEPAKQASPAAITPALLRALESWLTRSFDLPAADEQPRIAFAPEAEMPALRHKVLLRSLVSHVQAKTVRMRQSPAVAAFYHDMTRTIHLPAGWTGATAAEISVLVHEMVHHLQNMAGLRYTCPQAREALAFEAQERWLALSGKSLAGEFGLDGMTMLVKTRCMF
jgi:hypothetical protein